ncbi:MAG TPA: hypothetical protein VFY06_10775 [Verrucomicrobiae bacterium]|nr:hypothetical protein [Verrucomicrobiae bacterium]
MSVEQIEASIRALPPAERAQLAEWFEIHRAELMAGADEISLEVRDELELRLKEVNEHPEMLKPFEEEDLECMIQEAADAHAKKSSARRR